VVLVGDPETLDPLADALQQGQASRGHLRVARFAWGWDGLENHLAAADGGVVVATGGVFALDRLVPLARKPKRRRLQALEAYLQETADALSSLSRAGAVVLLLELPEEDPKRRRKKSLLEDAAAGLSAQCADAPNCVAHWAQPREQPGGGPDPSAEFLSLLPSFHALLQARVEWVAVVPVVSPWDADGVLVEPTVLSRERLFIRHSETRQKEVRFWAFSPQPEEPGQRYPVLYLLHGATGDYGDWRSHGRQQLLDLASRYGLVIVTPDGDSYGWYLDSPVEAGSAFESYFFDELIPYVEQGAGLPVAEGPSSRAIVGLSMGGHGALSLALRHPRAFRSASSMSGILDLTSHPKSWEIADRLGPLEEHRALWEEHSVTQLLRRGAGPELPILFACGDADRAAWTENLALHEKLTGANRDHEWRSSPEGHSWTFWMSELPHHVAFAAEYLRGDGVRLAPEPALPPEDPVGGAPLAAPGD
jgi:S-formylglutathione hydrolase FrmB